MYISRMKKVVARFRAYQPYGERKKSRNYAHCLCLVKHLIETLYNIF